MFTVTHVSMCEQKKLAACRHIAVNVPLCERQAENAHGVKIRKHPQS